MTNSENESGGDEHVEVEPSQDVHFEPVIKLEQVKTTTLEEDESTFYKIRSKIFRFDRSTSEWKERGTGELKMLQHSQSKKIRVVMRRDHTLKICANHQITSDMELKPNVGSDRSWVYTVGADLSEGEARPELLAIRFGTVEIAKQFKEKFEEAKKVNSNSENDDESPLPTTPATATIDSNNNDKKQENVENKKEEINTDTTTTNIKKDDADKEEDKDADNVDPEK